MAKDRIVYGEDVVIKNLRNWSKKKEDRLIRASKTQIAPTLERYAKANRPWQDRTGDARRGLHTQVVTSAGDIAIQLHHGVEYGLFLELKHAGKYAILKPTIEKNSRAVIGILKSAWG